MLSFLLAWACLSFNTYHEARGEGIQGMEMVNLVTMTRANHQNDKVCEVVLKPKQFSWADSFTEKELTPAQRFDRIRAMAPRDRQAWGTSTHVAYKALRGQISPDTVAIVGQADHYFNPNKANPSWKRGMKFIARINNHDVYQSNRTWR